MNKTAIDIRYKLAGLSFALVGAVVIALTAFFAARHVATATANLEAKARLYAKLFAHETESAVAFQDRETAREVFEAASLDGEVKALGLFGADGTQLGGTGEISVTPKVDGEVVMTKTPGTIACIAPVISKEGPRGVLVVEMTTANVDAEKRRVLQNAAVAGGLALLVGLFVSWIIGGSLARRLRRIQSATQSVAQGSFDAPPIEDPTKDEIGRLADDFNAMSGHIKNLVGTIEKTAAEEKARLDALVARRTAELTARNGDLRFVLDNVGQGFVTVDRTGALASERSAILERWFGSLDGEIRIWDALARIDPTAATWLQIGWESAFDGVIPVELAVDQLPRIVRGADSTFSVEYRPMTVADEVTKIILVISDVTAEYAARDAEAAQHELASVFGKLVSDRSGVCEFLEEGAALVSAIHGAAAAGATLTEQKRWFHTLKGNAAFFGLERLSAHCHVIESAIAEDGTLPTAEQIDLLGALWQEFAQTIAPLVSRRRDRIEIQRSDIQELATGLAAGHPRAQLVRAIRSWEKEPTEQRLARVAEQTRNVAERLGKAIDVQIEANGVRLDPEQMAPFWSALVHVVRNAVDHGVESPEVRTASGKEANGRVVLRTSLSPSEVVVDVEDDGQGIDFRKLSLRAQELGLPYEGEQVQELLFADGLSTKEEVTDISGRGVGLGAARAACEALGGRVDVKTELGKGTKFSFCFPRNEDAELPVSTRPSVRPSMRPVRYSVPASA